MNINDETKVKNFLKNIGVETDRLDVYKKALTHRSYLNEVSEERDESKELIHNERLEFLGDAVLELIVTEYLFEKYPERPEGELTSFRAATVRTESLAESSSLLGIGDFLFLSKGEELTGGRKKPYILANTYEAILGAIYLDKGFDRAKEFVYSNLINKISKIVKNRLDIDNKSKLQEISQDVLSITPRYELVEATGPDHAKRFTMNVVINSKVFGTGIGKNKQEAEQNAASDALKNWSKNVKEK